MSLYLTSWGKDHNLQGLFQMREESYSKSPFPPLFFAQTARLFFLLYNIVQCLLHLFLGFFVDTRKHAPLPNEMLCFFLLFTKYLLTYAISTKLIQKTIRGIHLKFYYFFFLYISICEFHVGMFCLKISYLNFFDSLYLMTSCFPKMFTSLIAPFFFCLKEFRQDIFG